MSNEYENLFEIRNFKLARTRDSTFAYSISRSDARAIRADPLATNIFDGERGCQRRAASLASRNTHRRRNDPSVVPPTSVCVRAHLVLLDIATNSDALETKAKNRGIDERFSYSRFNAGKQGATALEHRIGEKGFSPIERFFFQSVQT